MRLTSRPHRTLPHRRAARPRVESLEQRLQLSHVSTVGLAVGHLHHDRALPKVVSVRHEATDGWRGSLSPGHKSTHVVHQILLGAPSAAQAGRGARLVHRMSTPSSPTVTATSTQFSIGNDYAYGAAIQTDGKIVVAGTDGLWSQGLFAVARYNPDLSLDTSFGSGGKQTACIGNRSRVTASRQRSIPECGRESRQDPRGGDGLFDVVQG